MDSLVAPKPSAGGLSSAAAAVRLKLDGYNELPSANRRGFLRIFFEVMRQPMFALLIGGGVVYLLLGDATEAILLLLFAGLSVAITIVQESRSERVLQALRNLASPRARVLRDGAMEQIASREIVVGDVLIMSEGDRIAADATLQFAQDLALDESLLTGESAPVRKLASIASSAAPHAAGAIEPGGDDLPYLFAGTLVVRGSGRACVYATGARSEMGKIGRALGDIETEQPHLQRQLRWLVRDFALIGVVVGGLVVVLFGLLRGSWLEATLGGIAIGMSLLPQEFPMVMTVFMAMGAWRISQARVLTRRGAAIETLGATTVLCTDKTGTLTENRMRMTALVANDSCWMEGIDSDMSARVGELVAITRLACPNEPIDPMDIAVQAFAKEHIASSLVEPKRRSLIRAYGLQPDLFAVANILRTGDEAAGIACAKGALEAIVELCHLSSEQGVELRQQADRLAQRGIRVLAVAKAAVANVAQTENLPPTLRGLDFHYVGLIGFADPLRANVPAAVAECRSAGIKVVMITGDYPATASAIAREAGLDASRVVTGADIESMSDEQFAAVVKSTSIFARIRPQQKLRIVQSFKAMGEVVAMTGDGVNDAPAIKAANIGIAMGARGTDVAREAAAIVLLDDDFGSIVKTIRLGRRIYDNLRKAIEYIVAVHIPIAGLALLPLLLGLPLLLTPVHIAFLEMVIDPACSIVFEAEREEGDVMQRRPRDQASPLLLPRRIVWAVLQGVLVLAVLVVMFLSAVQAGMTEPDLRALVFASLVLTNACLILVNRSFKSSLIDAVLQPNRSLWILLGSVVALLGLAVYWPPLQMLFRFGALHWNDIAICFGASALTIIALEMLKARWFRTESRHNAPAPAQQGNPTA